MIIRNPVLQPPTPLGFVPLQASHGLFRRWLTPALSLVILAASLWQLRSIDVAATIRLVPASPVFWLLFVASYLAMPASEWVIYRRLWRLPAAGFAALLRKRVSNEVVLGYSGELYFYAWARRHAKVAASPFGAIKDVSILSAAVATAVTIALTTACWPLLVGLHLGAERGLIIGSVAAIAIPSAVALALSWTLFSLPRGDLIFVSLVHLARILLTMVLTALCWAWLVPSAPLGWWLGLSAVRLLVSRLPLMPNKDIVFAGIVAFTVGDVSTVTTMIAMLAGLWLLTHLLLGVVLTGRELLPAWRTA